jgi:hypothetical protein
MELPDSADLTLAGEMSSDPQTLTWRAELPYSETGKVLKRELEEPAAAQRLQ